MIMAHELTANVREGTLDTRAVELADMDMRQVERQMQELAATQKISLVPLGFSPLRSGLPTQEVDAMPLILDFTGVKMSQLKDVDGGQLEAEGRILAEVVSEHVLMCFCSRDPKVSLEPVVQGPAEEVEEAA
jgi:hypothetical protein